MSETNIIRLPNRRDRQKRMKYTVDMNVTTTGLIIGFWTIALNVSLSVLKLTVDGHESRINALVNDHWADTEPYFCCNM